MPGQPHVEDDEVGRLVGRDLEALLAGSGDRDLVALLLEGVLDAAGDGVLVFDDQDGGGHAAMLHRARSAPCRQVRRRAVVPVATPLPGASADPAPPASRSPDRRATTIHVRGPIPWPPPARRSPPSIATITGKEVARLRHAGNLPAVVYGHGVDSDNVTRRRPRVRAAPPARRRATP